jgi:hypothetical protein
LILQDGGTTDPASGVIYLGTPAGFYLELDNESQVLTTYVPHLQYLTTSIRWTNTGDIYTDTFDWTTIAKRDIYAQSERNLTLTTNGKLYLKSDQDASIVANTKLDVIAQNAVTVSAPVINFGGSGGKPNAIVRQTDLQYAVNQVLAYLEVHVHSNGNFGSPTGPPVIPPLPVMAPASTVIYETTGAPTSTGSVQLAAPNVVPPIPVT